MDNRFRDKRILLLSHYATTAMQDFLTIYLNNKTTERVKVVNFHLPEIPRLESIEVTEFFRGRKEQFYKIPTLIYPASLAYISHFFSCLFLILNSPSNDLVIAQNSILALAAIIGRGVGKTKRVVFYAHGISQKRFQFGFMNALYQKLDAYVYTHADMNWVLAESIDSLRKKYPHKSVYVVPANVPVAYFKVSKSMRKPTIVFIGVLNTMNGADILPDILRDLKADNPSICMDIIGIGPEEKAIKDKVSAYHLKTSIRFLGYQDLHTYAPTLSSYICGIAPYRPDDTSLLGTTDPMKIQLYAAAGIPTIVTEGFSFSKRISDQKMGIAVPFDSKKYANAILTLFENKKLYLSYRKSAKRYATDHDIFKTYDTVFQELI